MGGFTCDLITLLQLDMSFFLVAFEELKTIALLLCKGYKFINRRGSASSV
jgi:hypothetical protein